ncbi:hypothetical protein YC2023_005523 [Brassica napus]
MHSLKDAELAGLLIQPQRLFSNENIQDLCSSPIERFPSISRIFVVFKKDKPLIKEFETTLGVSRRQPWTYQVTTKSEIKRRLIGA